MLIEVIGINTPKWKVKRSGVSKSLEISQAQQIKELQREMTTLIGNLPGVAYRFDYQSRTLAYISEGCRELTGYWPGDFTGVNARVSVTAMIHQDDRERVRNEVRTAMEAKQSYLLEFRIIKPDGTIGWIWDKGCAIYSEQGEIMALEGFMIDITDRKTAELTVRKSGAHYRQLVEMSPETVYVRKGDQIVFINSAGLRMLGATNPDQVMGRSILDFLIHPESRELVVNRMESIDKERKEGSWVEQKWFRLDGSTVEVEVTAAPLAFEEQTIQVIAHDITYRKQAERQIFHLNRLYSVLSNVNQTIVRVHDQKQLFEEICRIVVEEGYFPLAWIGKFEPKTAQIRIVAHHGMNPRALDGYQLIAEKITLTNSSTGRAIREGKYQVCNDIEKAEWPELPFVKIAGCGMQSVAAFPIKIQHKVIGNFTLYGAQKNHFNPQEITLLEELTSDISYALEFMERETDLQQSYENLNKVMLQTVHALASTVEKRDPYTSGHQEKVARLAVALAAELNLKRERLKAVELAALIHDIGKIQIPAEILSKPGKLSDIEFELIKNHPQAGYEILNSIEFAWPIAKIVLEHHERLNGTGYPLGLHDQDILLEAKILGVADVVEAMASHRPYRPALGFDKALEEIAKNRGVLYDPDVVDSCIRLVTQKGFRFE